MVKRVLLAVVALCLCLLTVEAGLVAPAQPSDNFRESRAPAIIAPREATVAMPSAPNSRERRAGLFDGLLAACGLLVVALSMRAAEPRGRARQQTDGFFARRRGPPLQLVTA
jgi:hypothetical protein